MPRQIGDTNSPCVWLLKLDNSMQTVNLSEQEKSMLILRLFFDRGIPLSLVFITMMTATQVLDSPVAQGEAKQETSLEKLRGTIKPDQLPGQGLTMHYSGEAYVLSTDHQGKYLALTDPPSVIDLAKRKQMALEKPEEILGTIHWITLSPAGDLAVSGLHRGTALGPEVCIWETKTGKLLPARWEGHSAASYGVFTRDGKMFIHHNFDGNIYVRDTVRWEVKDRYRAIGGLFCFLDISADDRYLVASCFGGAVYVFDLKTKKVVNEKFGPIGEGGISAISPDGELIANWNRPYGGLVCLRSRTDAVVKKILSPKTSGYQMKFSPDGRWLAISGRGGVTIWDVKNMREHLWLKCDPSDDWAAACFARETNDMYLAVRGRIYRLSYR